jgi:hypothetical protein
MANVREEGTGAAGEGIEGALSPLGFDPNEALAQVSNVAREHPHAALAGAFAVGFLLGGGLTPRLLGAAALFAARRYFRAAVEETMASVQQNLESQLGGRST